MCAPTLFPWVRGQGGKTRKRNVRLTQNGHRTLLYHDDDDGHHEDDMNDNDQLEYKELAQGVEAYRIDFR